MPKSINLDMNPGESVEHYYHRLADAADHRLIRLEAMAYEPDFEGVKKFAYARAMKDLEVWGGNRFNTKMPESVNLRNEKIADIIHFLQSPTSTQTGIVNVYNKRADTINQKYGLNLKWQDMGKLMESFADDASGGSPTKIKALGVIKQIDKEGIEKTLKKNPNASDPMVMAMAMRYMQNPDKYADVLKNLNLKNDTGVINSMLQYATKHPEIGL